MFRISAISLNSLLLAHDYVMWLDNDEAEIMLIFK